MKQKGFTLVELLVVLAVMAIVGVVVFVNIKTASQEQVLKKALDDVQSLIRLAQSNATSGLICYSGRPTLSWIIEFPNPPSGSPRNLVNLKCSYQVSCPSFEANNPQCDMDGDGDVDSTDQNLRGTSPTTPPGYKPVRSLTLDNTTVNSISGAGGTGCPSFPTTSASLSFTPISGKLKLGSDTCSALTITLQDTSQTKSFTINKGGAVNVQ